MARKSTTRPKVGTIVVSLNTFWTKDSARPEYRGSVTIGDQTLDVSLWINERVPGTAVPLYLSGEISEKTNG